MKLPSLVFTKYTYIIMSLVDLTGELEVNKSDHITDHKAIIN